MKLNLKTVVIGLIVVLFLFFGYCFYADFNFSKKEAKFLKDKEARIAQVARLEVDKEKHKQNATHWKMEAEKLEVERDKIAESLREARERLEEEIVDIPNMELTELMVKIPIALNLPQKEVIIIDFGLGFSLLASQKTFTIFVEAEFYLKVEKPKLLDFAQKAEEETKHWRKAYTNLDVALTTSEEQVKELGKQVAKDQEMITTIKKKVKQASFKATVKTVIAVGIGYLIVKEVIIPLFEKDKKE